MLQLVVAIWPERLCRGPLFGKLSGGNWMVSGGQAGSSRRSAAGRAFRRPFLVTKLRLLAGGPACTCLRADAPA